MKLSNHLPQKLEIQKSYEKLSAQLMALQEDTTWKHLGGAHYGEELALPASFNELHIEGISDAASVNMYRYTLHIINTELSEDWKDYFAGHMLLQKKDRRIATMQRRIDSLAEENNVLKKELRFWILILFPEKSCLQRKPMKNMKG